MFPSLDGKKVLRVAIARRALDAGALSRDVVRSFVRAPIEKLATENIGLDSWRVDDIQWCIFYRFKHERV